MSGKARLKRRAHYKASAAIFPIVVAIGVLPTIAQALDDEIVVTATRRAESIQDIPLNISAIGGDQLVRQGFDDLSELAAFVPGINIVDQGGRDGNRIVVRGLNAEPIESAFGQEDGGGTVATYVGEIPLFVDLRLNDLQRVEVLLGPQGTLYGAGSMGGAVRYIPNKPDFSSSLLEVRTDAYAYNEGDGLSSDAGITFNVPLSDRFAIRGSIDILTDGGFIDYPYVVKEPGVSEPDPDFSDAAAMAASFNPVEDANTEDVVSGRFAARLQPVDAIDATLTYYFQQGEYGGRNTTSYRTTTIPAGKYEFGARVQEPSERDNQLLALEVIADLGFAELTSATGYAQTTENGQRDQTDLLISLEYSYETFPTFTAFTFEDEETEIFNQELRLVSKGDSQLNWIIGAFYNKNEYRALSSEFTPGYVAFNGKALPTSGALEYFQADRTELTEQAFFGEVGFEITPDWDLTVGARYYEYELDAGSETFFPLAGYLFDDIDGFEAYTLGEIDQNLPIVSDQSDDGALFKINTSYKFSNGNIVYATFSQGYRVGATNGGALCEGDYLTDSQNLCLYVPGQEIRDGDGQLAILDELSYTPDTVDNYEIGAKTTWLDGNLRLNGALFFMEWKDPQVSAVSINAGTSITVNAASATTKGIELDGNWQATEHVNVRGNVSFVDAKLTEDVPGLIRALTPPGFGSVGVTGEDGDRLSGSPEKQFSVFVDHVRPLQNGNALVVNAGYSWQGDVLSLAGGRGGSFTLPSYGRATLALGYKADAYSITGYVDNLFNDFSESSVANTPDNNQTVEGANVRRFRTNALPPRSIGVRLQYRFQ